MAHRNDGLVIFDCDGVLVDSEPISISVLTEIIAEAGGRIDLEEAYRRFLGRSVKTIVSDLANENGLAVTDLHLEAMRDRLYARFRDELKPIPGIAETLGRLDRPFCVASSSQPERIRLSLAVTGLLERFEPNVFSSTMVERGKPAPDLFLHAARAMEKQPGRCIVVEDSPAGITAAKRAGMQVVAFVGGSHVEPAGLASAVAALHPDAICGSMTELPSILEGLDGRNRAS
ncbi:HAD family hydrolase [Zhengella mangrovi]|uniref:HAD family hydrolase n=1 Tax=Zhengella mangrovi TaxID=1982044 RepID=UPI001FDF258C|nr:HAD family hydrolase [Zhengella mangrovi]